MKIKDALNQCATQRVKIASENGSGWWFAGDKNKFRPALANAAMIRWHKKRVARAMESCVSAYKATLQDYEEWEKIQKSRFADSSRKAYDEWLEKATGFRLRMENAAKERMAEMRNAVSISRREVIEVSEADKAVEPVPCTRIVVVGVEDGAFWDCAEADQFGAPLCFLGINLDKNSAAQ